ncbi:hypothetical protein BL250_08900 [Erwinia sp. OLTSP20]|uniref:conjugal transfer mating-pair stabilization protein TraG n=1 Tax=unclassified Erwinia TaxID=2622719 RepID=UPI000C1A4216|nr:MULTISPECIES: conjugal transfer mating-pair stabilization protein TraG [unclassified Erwinia]PIJ50038.1 conjugal transfer protein TraG [Erwinia sp. OAMSP11]PIJ72416.1 hypothetical protein BK416_09335 [Erwinia sp. OLSSP12]PIJ80039.1 hypothetical protein BLD47_11905 [Erwinia sp. OLCASP19]PIJ82163.1 hypothetical protein BLD46_11830 [Erwinia sp. OLMTSP26]PIJ86399.1 hypothetical protein BLD49_08525 [Erwinia sp. OLMDSP33]
MAIDIWVTSSGGMITMGLNAVAAMMRDTGWKSVMWIAEVLGILTCIYTYLKSHDLRVMFYWAFTFVIVTALLLTPKVTVVVNDLTAPDTVGRVDNVPLGLAAPLWIVTGTGYTIATTYENFFHFPDERTYTKTGMMFASKLMQDSFTIAGRDPVLAINMVSFTKNCVVPDIMLNHKYSMQDVMASAEVQSVIFSKPSPLRGIYWRDAAGSAFMYCRDAAPRLKNLLAIQGTPESSTFMYHAARMLPGTTSPATAYASQLEGSYNYFFSSSQSAKNIILQNVAVAGLRRGLNSYVKGMNDTASMVDIASEQSLMKLRLSHAVSYAIATEVLPQLHTVLLLFCVCIFPVMVLALFVREISMTVCKNYLNFMGSLMLWPVMFAIFNFAVNFGTQGSFNASGPTLSNMNRLMETSSTTAGIAGWLMLSIPFLAFKLFTQLGQNFASLSSSLGSALGGASTADASAVASGNYSMANMQMENINGFKTNLNREYREGNTSMQLGNGAMETHTAAGQTVWDASPGISRLPVDLNWDRHLSSAAQKMTRDSMSQTETALSGYNHSVQQTASQLKQFHDQFGNSDSSSLSAQTGMSVNEAEKVHKMMNVASDYNNRNHLGTNEGYSELQNKSRDLAVNAGMRGQAGFDSSKSLWGKAGQWVTGASAKGDIHAGLEGTARTGSTSQTTEDGRKGQDYGHTLSAREAKDFSEGLDVLRNYNMTHNGQHVDTNASGLMNQISAGITTSDSAYQQYTTSQSHTHELQRMASETETLSAGAKENYNQQFAKWVKERTPEQAQEILTNASDTDVSQRREGLVQQFVDEKLRGRIDGNYESNAGQTGQGMTSPANTAGAQFGGAYNSANNQIDGHVADNNIRTDVKKDVDDVQRVIKNKSAVAQHKLEEGRSVTEQGRANRRQDMENIDREYSINKNAADKQQEKTIVNPLVNHSYKDYTKGKE